MVNVTKGFETREDDVGVYKEETKDETNPSVIFQAFQNIETIRNQNGSGWKLEYHLIPNDDLVSVNAPSLLIKEYDSFLKELELITLSYTMNLVKDTLTIKLALTKFFRFYLLQGVLKCKFNISLGHYINGIAQNIYVIEATPLDHNFSENYEDAESIATQTIIFKINIIRMFVQ